MKIQYNLRLIFFLITLFIGVAQADDERVEYFGTYTHIEPTMENHCKGYSVKLWKYKDSLVGFLYHLWGLCADSPMGILEDMLYIEQTGSLSFNVKLSNGLVFQAGKWVPSKDKVSFKGKLNGQILKGDVTWSQDGKTKPIRSENISLKLESQESSSSKSFDNYDKWVNYRGPILKSRGPKW